MTATYLKRLTLWIIGALDASWISTGPNWSPTTRSVLVLGSHSCQTLSVDAVSLWSPQLRRPLAGSLPRPPSFDHGPSCEWRRRTGRPRQTCLKTVETDQACDQWTLAWRQSNDVHRTERHGDNSWQRLRPRQAPKESHNRTPVHTKIRRHYFELHFQQASWLLLYAGFEIATFWLVVDRIISVCVTFVTPGWPVRCRLDTMTCLILPLYVMDQHVSSEY